MRCFYAVLCYHQHYCQNIYNFPITNLLEDAGIHKSAKTYIVTFLGLMNSIFDLLILK